ncbi:MULTISPECIES: ROK family transcriptional regulator [Streptomyces]|uniref:NBD/HSP70 family sugar kinase n=2 Tax=Streptomyces TaxID=1883 RepID=A0ABT9L586_9ACTN|nr:MULTISPECIES: ROK family transcriptional regulator [Streptomyces]MBW8090787.1 ROK family transcriptional regulator [Streptomyces hygroscopicus subsp. hygroscopicus]MCO8302962.1 ROK family transcriptional regulator [Streptomyces sp. RKCA744]MDN3058105.1 ROK family transcriptional regulator [Streptomyces sp. SRF1]MDP9615854.1 putative NBD/HSP70 family sugar kinase [Streptomyces demainii]GHJ33750.1 transcriptional regulator [Streptomyces hygroscopicus]
MATTGTDMSRMREMNQLSIVWALRGHPPSTVTELARRAGLSRPAVDVLVQALVADGWAEVEEPGASSVVGRPARRFRFRATAGHVLGIDIGVHKILVMLSDLEGSLVRTVRRPADPQAAPEARLAAVDGVIDEVLRDAGMTPGDIWAVTVGVTGPVDATGRTTLSTPLPGWHAADPAAHLAARFSCPIQVENDCKLAAVAERWNGAAQDADDIVFLLAGLRTGAGLILDGTLRRGHGGAAGEIGALKAVRWLTAPGHLESCPGIPATAAPGEAAAWVFQAARDGDRGAKAAIRRYTRDLAVGVAALVLALDPQVVVYGGGFSRSADVILDPLRRELAKHCLRLPELRASTLGDESVALGAVRLALDEVDSRLLSDGLAAPAAPRR